MHAIRAEGLIKRYGGTTALDGVDLEVPAGQAVGILGPAGAGKTTMVRILATLVRPDGGRAEVGGHDVVREAARVRELVGRPVPVDEDLPGMEHLVLAGRLLGLPGEQARARAAELLERLTLTEAADRPLATLPGGLRRRLDLAAGLVGRPRVLLLDEPTSGLDPRTRDALWRVVGELVSDGTTLLLTTRDLEEAGRLADRVTVIDGGRVAAEGRPGELKRRVGGQVLHVRPTLWADLDAVAGILGELTGTDRKSVV